LAKKCDKHGYKFNYAIKYSMTVNEPIFTKLVFARQRSDFYTVFHENMANG